MFTPFGIRFQIIAITCVGMWLGCYEPRIHAQDTAGSTKIEWKPVDLKLVNADASIDGNRLKIRFKQAPGSTAIEIPRLYNSIRSAYVERNGSRQSNLTVEPGLETWTLKWAADSLDERSDVLTLELDSQIVTKRSETVQMALPDGSYSFQARHASTRGSKLRFEPQPNKNTVGYWVDPQDVASWTMRVDKPGKFNVAVLQGCGAGQGNSQVSIDLFPSSSPELKSDRKPLSSLVFTVEETGHFQNFRWRHLGEIEIQETGELQLEVRVVKLANKAVMDIREIQLIRLPGR